jgi:cytoskeletal protein RodZ
MADVCSRCGVELHPGAKTCSVCGAPVGLASATASTSDPVHSGNAPTLPAAKKKSHLVLKIVLSVVGVVFLGFVGLIILGNHVIQTQKQAAAQAAQAASNSTPAAANGPASVATGVVTLTAKDLGMPLYPGATVDPGGTQTTSTATMHVVNATLWTVDSVSSVTQYYQNQLGSQVTVMGLGSETILSVGGGNNTATMMIDSENGKTKMVVIHSTKTGN